MLCPFIFLKKRSIYYYQALACPDYYYVQEHVKITPIRDQKQTRFYGDKNMFYFLETKIKIYYIFKDKKFI